MVLLVWTIPACDDDGVGGARTGSIQASPSAVAFSVIEIGDTGVEVLRLRNTSADESLRVLEIDLGADEGDRIDELTLHDVPQLPVTIEAGDEIQVTLEYAPVADAPANRGYVRVANTDPNYNEEPLKVPVRTLGNEPEFFAEPPVVRFQRIQPGQNADQVVRITNVGSGPMRIFEEPVFDGGSDFRIEVPSRSYPLDLLPYDTVLANESPQDYYLEIDVVYAPLGDGEDTGNIQVKTNDVDEPGQTSRTHEIDVRADADSACIAVDSRTRNFGQVPIGEVARDLVTVSNCGSQPLEIDGVFLVDEHGVYNLELGPWDQTGDGTVDGTVTIPPEESDSFFIRFAPVEEGTRRGDVVIASNDPFQPELNLDLVARGAEGSCPTAVATAQVRGTPMQPSTNITATPLDYVILDGSGSEDPDGEVVDWQWEVLERPPGININLEPTQDDPNNQDQSRREFQPLTAGIYRIGLNVIDDSGFRSCEQAEVMITAIPDQSIHIELTWTNPEDPDETDDFGSDVDLHLTKMGPGQWFEAPYSIFYLNPNQSEDPIWNPEDPSLDIDVRDGLGPENITMRTPDDCQWYAVGVHYFQKAFGTAYATVRIYINGDLRYVRPYFPLEETGHFWDVARIHWDANNNDATIVEVDGFYPIPPAQQDPAVTQDMIDTGRCTAEGLY